MIIELEMKRILFILAAGCFALTATAKAPKSDFPIDATKATLISDPNNQMTHYTSTHVTKDGEIWIAYFRDLKNNVEDPNELTIEMVLSRFDIKKWRSPKIKHSSLLKVGGTIGSFNQGNSAPYDPILFDAGDKITCIYQAYEDGGNIYIAFTIDPESGTPVGEVERCTLTYTHNGEKFTVPLSKAGNREYYEKALGVTNFKGFEKPVLNKKYTKHGEWYYTALANWCCQGSIPVVLRTKDGIHYEEVFRCPEFKYGTSEIEIAIHNDRLYLIARTARPENKLRAGTFLAVYSMDGECIRKPYFIGDVESRPEMIVYKDEVYAMYNVKPNTINYETGKGVNRSRVRLAKLDDHGSVVHAWEYASPYSMQYYSLNEYKGKLYLSFIEDRFGRVNAKKGNLSFVELGL